jgi:spermidine synthase
VSPRLGRLDVVEDHEGVKLLAHGTLYAVHPPTPTATPPPWIALAAAVFMAPRQSRPDIPLRVGLLGYGGGTVARLLRGADPSLRIAGVDLDATLVELGRKHLAGAVSGVRLHLEDASAWLRRPGEPFDALLDDLYAPVDGALGRPAEARDIPLLARRRLNSGGVYAVNLRSPGGDEERRVLTNLRTAFRHVRLIYTREYAHKVVVAADAPFRRGAFAEALRRLFAGDPPGAAAPRVTPAGLGFLPVRAGS